MNDLTLYEKLNPDSMRLGQKLVNYLRHVKRIPEEVPASLIEIELYNIQDRECAKY